MGEIPQTPLTRGGRTPSRALPTIVPLALGERQRRSMAIPLSTSQKTALPYSQYAQAKKKLGVKIHVASVTFQCRDVRQHINQQE